MCSKSPWKNSIGGLPDTTRTLRRIREPSAPWPRWRPRLDGRTLGTDPLGLCGRLAGSRDDRRATRAAHRPPKTLSGSGEFGTSRSPTPGDSSSEDWRPGTEKISTAAKPPMARFTTCMASRPPHKTLPLGTYVRVKNLQNNQQIDLRINDRGPFVRGRIIDLSYEAARRLLIVGPGTAPVEVVALGAPSGETGGRPAYAPGGLLPRQLYFPGWRLQGSPERRASENQARRDLHECPYRSI